MSIEQLFLSIVILLAGARILGEIFRRLKQPALIGELLAGIILGPTLFGVVRSNDSLEMLSNIAIFCATVYWA